MRAIVTGGLALVGLAFAPTRGFFAAATPEATLTVSTRSVVTGGTVRVSWADLGLDLESLHVYPSVENFRFGKQPGYMLSIAAKAARAASTASAKKAVYLGEFGVSLPDRHNASSPIFNFTRDMLAAAAASSVRLATYWAWEDANQRQTWGIWGALSPTIKFSLVKYCSTLFVIFWIRPSNVQSETFTSCRSIQTSAHAEVHTSRCQPWLNNGINAADHSET